MRVCIYKKSSQKRENKEKEKSVVSSYHTGGEVNIICEYIFTRHLLLPSLLLRPRYHRLECRARSMA